MIVLCVDLDLDLLRYEVLFLIRKKYDNFIHSKKHVKSFPTETLIISMVVHVYFCHIMAVQKSYLILNLSRFLRRKLWLTIISKRLDKKMFFVHC